MGWISSSDGSKHEMHMEFLCGNLLEIGWKSALSKDSKRDGMVLLKRILGNKFWWWRTNGAGSRSYQVAGFSITDT
jgi:hypothetical protein